MLFITFHDFSTSTPTPTHHSSIDIRSGDESEDFSEDLMHGRAVAAEQRRAGLALTCAGGMYDEFRYVLLLDAVSSFFSLFARRGLPPLSPCRYHVDELVYLGLRSKSEARPTYFDLARLLFHSVFSLWFFEADTVRGRSWKASAVHFDTFRYVRGSGSTFQNKKKERK